LFFNLAEIIALQDVACVCDRMHSACEFCGAQEYCKCEGRFGPPSYSGP
jgi:hypothetical protein